MSEKFTFDVDEVYTRLGYDPKDPVRYRDIPERLLEDVGLDQGRRGNRVSDKPTVVEALASVMEEVQAIRKGDRNTQQNFNFRGVDAVVNAVGPALRKHGVVVVPTGAVYEQERYESRNGASMRGVTTNVCYRFYGPAGDWIDAGVLGEASDAGDKAIPKAFSVAYRTLLLQTLCVPTDEVDPDAQSHERVVDSAVAPRDEVLARNGSAGGDGASDRGKPSSPADVVIHFGKNSGQKLSELKPKQIEWYAQTWEPNPQYANDADRRLKEAAIALHLGTEGIAAPVDDMESIPF